MTRSPVTNRKRLLIFSRPVCRYLTHALTGPTRSISFRPFRPFETVPINTRGSRHRSLQIPSVGRSTAPRSLLTQCSRVGRERFPLVGVFLRGLIGEWKRDFEFAVMRTPFVDLSPSIPVRVTLVSVVVFAFYHYTTVVRK